MTCAVSKRVQNTEVRQFSHVDNVFFVGLCCLYRDFRKIFVTCHSSILNTFEKPCQEDIPCSPQCVLHFLNNVCYFVNNRIFHVHNAISSLHFMLSLAFVRYIVDMYNFILETSILTLHSEKSFFDMF